MFKLLVIAPYYRPAYIYGGPVRSIPALCEGIAASGVSVTVFTTDANGRGRVDEPTSIPVQVDGVEVWYFPRIRSRVAPMFFYSPELSRKCDAAVSGFDGVYIAATWTYPMLAGARAAHRSGGAIRREPNGQLYALVDESKSMEEAYLPEMLRTWRDGACVCDSLHERSRGRADPNIRFLAAVRCAQCGAGTAEWRLQSACAFRRQLGIPEEGSLTISLVVNTL